MLFNLQFYMCSNSYKLTGISVSSTINKVLQLFLLNFTKLHQTQKTMENNILELIL